MEPFSGDENRMIEKMLQGRTAIGLGTTMLASGHVPAFAAKSGYDWAFIDLEHTLISHENVVLTTNLLRVHGVTPLVRIPKGALHDVARLLDSGVQGIALPHVEHPDEAAELVDMCKFAPIGDRSWGGASPQLGYPQRPQQELMTDADRTTLALVMIESAAGVENIDTIVQTPGLDGVLIGGVDLSIDLGVMGQTDAPVVIDAINKVGHAAKSCGLFFGLAGISSPKVLDRLSALNVDFVLAGMDYRILALALDERANQWRR